MVTFKRHLDEQIRLRLTAYDDSIPAQRQSVLGVDDLCFTLYRLPDMAVIIDHDPAHCVIEEVDDQTVGDIMWSAPPGTITAPGRYLAKFTATVGGVLADFPEDGYVTLIIT